MFFDDLMHPAEKQLFGVILQGDPEKIHGLKPDHYKTKNIKTGRIVTYFACSPDRALALAYMDQGWDHEIIHVTD